MSDLLYALTFRAAPDAPFRLAPDPGDPTRAWAFRTHAAAQARADVPTEAGVDAAVVLRRRLADVVQAVTEQEAGGDDV